jgi:serine protease Do
MNTHRRTGRATLPVVAALTVAAASAIALAERPSLLHAAPPAADTIAAVTPTRSASPSVAKLADLSDAFATIAAKVKPSVVYITAREEAQPVVQRRQRGRQSPNDGNQIDPNQLPPELREMLRGFGGMQGMGGDEAPERPRGGGIASGSGFIVSNDGYILTNNHVVDGASEVKVRLLDRREFKAKVIGRDPNTDVAVIKIDANGLTPAPLGDSEASRVGEWVLAVGNPLGENLTFTVTQGIISAKGRALQLPGQSNMTIQDFIQTDAAINPGNSGGPLVDVNGNVIGINSAIESPTGYNAGYGFAVPINLARSVMNQIIKTGHVERVALGVSVRDASADDAAYAGMKSIGGVLVNEFSSPNSAAKKAGLQPGDVIVSVDGKKTDYVAQLQQLIAFHKPGDVVSLQVARKGGQLVTIRVPLQRAEGEDAAADTKNDASDKADDKGSSMHQLGVSVAPLDAQTAKEFGIPSDVKGLLVMGTKDGTSAANHLYAADEGGPDVILSVEGKTVDTPEQLKAALQGVKTGDIVSLNVYNARAKARRIERVRVGASE